MCGFSFYGWNCSFTYIIYFKKEGGDILKIREIREEKMKDAIDIFKNEIWPETHNKLAKEWVTKGWGEFPYTQYFIAEENGKILAAIAWSIWDMYGKKIILELSAIAVKERRKGIGRKILLESLNCVKTYWQERNLNIVAWNVETDESNETARRFYKSFSPSYVAVFPYVWGEGNETGVAIYFFLQ